MTCFLCLKRSFALRSSTRNCARLSQQRFFNSTHLRCEGVYWPQDFEPYTPAHHFKGGNNDPKFRTKLKIARELVMQAVEEGIPFRAVVADSFYGEDEELRWTLRDLGAGYVLALKSSHGWWHREEIGALWEAALGAGWEGPHSPGEWARVERRLRDGHTEEWWALEVEAGPYGPERAQRAVLSTTDPEKLPERKTWYLVTKLPHPSRSERSGEGDAAAAELAEVVGLYGSSLESTRTSMLRRSASASNSDQSAKPAAARSPSTRPPAPPAVPPVVVRERAAPRALSLHPVDRPTAPAHEVADELPAAQLRPDQTRAWRRHVSRQDAFGPLATLSRRRPNRRHAPELHARAQPVPRVHSP
jgi:DDE superfamily endonuclease